MSPTKVCPQCGAVYGGESRFCSVDGASLVVQNPADDLVGTIVAERYHILERIGAGGMGEVFLAEHVRMRRKSALKVMRDALTSDPVAVSRFHREAENASQINHPNVAAVYDFGETSSGLVYIAMEYVAGEPLSVVLAEEGCLNPARVADVIVQAADALSAAHALGILHRDLKPDNIMLTSTRWGTDLVKLVDFGISRAMASATQQFTSTGMIVGTPDYMSPEQLTGDVLDSRSDQYALGLIAYYALTGTFPFPSGTTKDALLTRLTNAPRKLAEVHPDVEWPPALQATLDRALAMDVSERYPEVLDFGREFDAAIAEMPATETMEHYREALRQRYTTPTRGPSVTPPRAVPSIEMTPPAPHAPLPAGETDIAASEPVPTAEPLPAMTLGKPAPRRASLKGRLTAIGAMAALVALIVWKFATGADSEASTRPSPAALDAARMPTAPAAAQTAAGSVAPLLSLDSTAARARGGVFTVYGPRQQGVAVLVDSSGIVLTSMDFARDAEVRIQLEAERHVAGRVMAVDTVRRLAALRIPIQHCKACVSLSIASDSASAPSVGDSLVVPAPNGRGATAVESRGAVTQVDARTVQASLPAVALGSPALSNRGIVGLAVRRTGTQAGLVGAHALTALRNRARQRKTDVLPNDSLLPAWPARPVPRSELERAKSRSDTELVPYKVSAEGISVLVMTPQVMAWRQAQVQRQIDADRLMSLSETQATGRVDPIQLWNPWESYLAERRAAVVLHVTPMRAEYGRLTRRSLEDLRSGDIVGVFLYRDNVLVTPIETARTDAIVNADAYRTNRLHVYQAGIAVYRPRDFAPSANGRFPEMRLEIVDNRPKRTVKIVLPEAALTAVQRDLAAYQR